MTSVDHMRRTVARLRRQLENESDPRRPSPRAKNEEAPTRSAPSPLERIVLSSLWPSSSHPIRLYGRFDEHGCLDYASAPDLGVTWTRAGQAPADFERLIANAILQIRGLPTLDEIDPRGTRGVAPAVARPRVTGRPLRAHYV
jgi:hypothetical protein